LRETRNVFSIRFQDLLALAFSAPEQLPALERREKIRLWLSFS